MKNQKEVSSEDLVYCFFMWACLFILLIPPSFIIRGILEYLLPNPTLVLITFVLCVTAFGYILLSTIRKYLPTLFEIFFPSVLNWEDTKDKGGKPK